MASLFCFYAFSPNYKYQVNIFRKGGSNIPEIQYWKRTVKEFIMQRKKQDIIVGVARASKTSRFTARFVPFS